MMMSNIPLLLCLMTAIYLTSATLPLEDATAIVNRLFTYKLDPNDFSSGLLKVTEVNQDSLPSWLAFNKKTNELHGVPTANDKRTFIISVNTEMFAITVTEATKHQVAQPISSDEQTICKAVDSITVVYVKLNTDTDRLAAERRSDLVNTLSSQLSLKPQHISLVAQPKDLLDTGLALVSGVGDVPPQTEGGLSALSWVVGCGAVKSHHMDILEKLESSARDGTMSKHLQADVSGWQVQSNQPKNKSKRRLKRQVGLTATPSPSASSSVEEITPSSSGDGPEPSTDVVTPSQTTPEPTTPKVVTQKPNKPPAVQQGLLPVSLSANGGQIVRWEMPDGFFTDPEGEELTYEISSGAASSQWNFNLNSMGRRELLGLASPDLQGSTEMVKLIASDPQGYSTEVVIEVQHGLYQKSDLTELYTVEIKQTRELRQSSSYVYIALALQEVARMQKILVESAEKNRQRGIITVTFGDNRGIQTTCPEAMNRDVLMNLRKAVGNAQTTDQGISVEIADVVKVQPISPCSAKTPVVNPTKLANIPLTVSLGELFEAVLPVDLFMDYEDGDLSKLELRLLVDGLVESNGWISLNDRTLQALTWDMPESESQFTLVAEDSDGNEEEAEINVKVVDNSPDVKTNLFTITLDENYSTFANSHTKQISLYKGLRNAFPGSNVMIESVKPGSVVVQFSLNNPQLSNSGEECPKAAIDGLTSAVFDGEKVKKSFTDNLAGYKLSKAEFAPMGSCEGVVKPMSSQVKEPASTQDDEEEKGGATTIIIIVVVVITVLIIVIVVVIICIKKRKAKQAQSAAGKNGSYIEKGVPVVMDEEMKSIDKRETQPLMADNSAEVSYKPTPPAYPGEEREDDYQPPTPPVSEPDDERRMLDRSP